MKLKYDVVKPNLHIVNGSIFFGINPRDLISTSRLIDKIVGRNMEGLKVLEGDLKLVQDSQEGVRGEYISELSSYIDAIGEEHYSIGSEDIRHLNLPGFIIRAQNSKNPNDVSNWCRLQRDLENPDEAFDKYEDGRIFKLDRERTLEEMKKLAQELEPKVPTDFARFVIIPGYIPVARGDDLDTKYFGAVTLRNLKGEDNSLVNKTRKELKKGLKKIPGPCLSKDSPDFYQQVEKLSVDAHHIINRYGDVITSSLWESKLFVLDP